MVLFISFCSSVFLSGVIFHLPERFYSIFAIDLLLISFNLCRSASDECFQLFMLKILPLVFLERYFCLVEHSSLIVIFFQYFKDFVSLPSPFHCFWLEVWYHSHLNFSVCNMSFAWLLLRYSFLPLVICSLIKMFLG